MNKFLKDFVNVRQKGDRTIVSYFNGRTFGLTDRYINADNEVSFWDEEEKQFGSDKTYTLNGEKIWCQGEEAERYVYEIDLWLSSK